MSLLVTAEISDMAQILAGSAIASVIRVDSGSRGGVPPSLLLATVLLFPFPSRVLVGGLDISGAQGT